ncbi:fluoride efflux transporter CrcB [Puia sp. P3]|uniref:fluoride efflux transporter CrcB n=1 Tax=Puia sp. P3 TaxID=3423952 RepID=UPI003D675AEB
MKPLLIVGIGGAIGSICRYLAQVYIGKYTTLTFPIGTLVVNITGCFLIGLLFGLSSKHAWLTMEWRLFLITGICGGYTTFSSFSLESITLFRNGNYTYFLIYALGSTILGLLATVGGSAIIR